MERWALEHDLNVRDVRRAMALERHAYLKTRLEDVEEGVRALDPHLADADRDTLSAEERAAVEEQFEGLSKERDELERRLKESMKDLGAYVDSKEELKNSPNAQPKIYAGGQLTRPARRQIGQLKQLLQTHAEWETAFGRGKSFRPQ